MILTGILEFINLNLIKLMNTLLISEVINASSMSYKVSYLNLDGKFFLDEDIALLQLQKSLCSLYYPTSSFPPPPSFKILLLPTPQDRNLLSYIYINLLVVCI